MQSCAVLKASNNNVGKAVTDTFSFCICCLDQETTSHWKHVTILTFLPWRTEGRPRKHTLACKACIFALMWRWDSSHYQISVIFLQLTRLSTSQRYELIKGVFHTATTRTCAFITPVPHMQSQEGQGEDCYICWFVFFSFWAQIKNVEFEQKCPSMEAQHEQLLRQAKIW